MKQLIGILGLLWSAPYTIPTFLLTLTNPLTILFWAGVMGATSR